MILIKRYCYDKKNDEDLNKVTGGFGFPPCEQCKRMFEYNSCNACAGLRITSIIEGDPVKHFECDNGYFEPLNYDIFNRKIV